MTFAARYRELAAVAGGCPIEAGLLLKLADNECVHERLPFDRTPQCGCWPQECGSISPRPAFTSLDAAVFVSPTTTEVSMSTPDTVAPETPAAPAEAPFGFKDDGTPRKRPRPSDEVIARSIATRRANGKHKTNGKANGQPAAITAADERKFSGFDLDAAIADITRLAANAQRHVAELREQLAAADAECDRLTAAATVLAEV